MLGDTGFSGHKKEKVSIFVDFLCGCSEDRDAFLAVALNETGVANAMPGHPRYKRGRVGQINFNSV